MQVIYHSSCPTSIHSAESKTTGTGSTLTSRGVYHSAGKYLGQFQSRAARTGPLLLT